MAFLPKDVVEMIGESTTSFRDTCNLAASSHFMHTVVGPISEQNKQLQRHHLKVYMYDRHDAWPEVKVLQLSRFKHLENCGNIQTPDMSPTGLKIFIDTDDQDALMQLCQHVNAQHPNIKIVEFDDSRRCVSAQGF